MMQIKTIMHIAAMTAALSGTVGASALTTKAPDRAVMALRDLGPGDLDTGSPRGKAFVQTLFPDHAQHCGAPSGPNPDFDDLCVWSQTDADDDFDMLVGINDKRIVSVVTTWPRQLAAKTWACEPFYTEDGYGDSQLSICSVASASAADRSRWAQSWRDYLNSIG